MNRAGEGRQRALGELAGRRFDLLVIGGGATGCGIARDAALRGLATALVEKTDLGAGTSSKSSKLIHGGLRYLEHAQLRLVFEGTNERALLRRRAPHLVRPIPFLMPAYKESRPGLIKLDVGLWIYDALSGFSSPHLHQSYRARRIQEMEPDLRTDALKGGIIYYDCITDDARVTLENGLDAHALGATVATHAPVVGLRRDDAGRICGAEVLDAEPDGAGTRIAVQAKVVVNAAGPWCDEIRRLAGQEALLKPTKGIHLVVDAARLAPRHAVVMLARRDHRVTFALPWGCRTILGTTDTYYDGDLDRVWATRDDADYLLETANHYFPSARLGISDVLATWAGLRPLIRPDSGLPSASDVSREHHIVEEPGLIAIAGGKLTTYRRMAAEVMDHVVEQLLDERGKIPASCTAERPLPGAAGIDSDEGMARVVESLVARRIPATRAQHLVDIYGVRAHAVAARGEADPSAAGLLDPELLHTLAEVDEAVEHEMARTVVDVLGRRVPLLLRARDQGLGAAPIVARRMARALDWNEARVRQEIDRYREVVEDTRRFRQ